MATRNPIQAVGNTQLTASLVDYYVAPDGKRAILAAVAFNNTSALTRTVTLHIVPLGDSSSSANQYVTSLVVPPSGSQPTQVPGLVGQVLQTGATLSMSADVAATVTPLISVYETDAV